MRTQWPMWSFLIIIWVYPGEPLHAAEIVELKVASGITATARYHQGESNKPAILLMHGFLQTRDFSTIARLFDTLSSSGYTTLSPTLTLGLSHRSKSLPCESIHTNSMSDDLSEIGQWTAWLSKKSNKPLVLIGHSMGATQIAAFLEQYRGDQVKQAILISIGPIGLGWPDNYANYNDLQRAKSAVIADEKGLSEYGLAYCKKYVTTAHNLLSFYHWDFERVSSAVSKLPMPTQIIIGSEDTLINPSMIRPLASRRVSIDVLEGAGHFFNKEFEFELHDAVESYLPNKYREQD